MRRFIIFSLLLLAGVQESNAYVIYSAEFRSVDRVRKGYSETSKYIAYLPVPGSWGLLQVEVLYVSCKGEGYEMCPATAQPGDYSNPVDADHVNKLSRYATGQMALGQSNGSHVVIHEDAQTGKRYRYVVFWELDGEDVRTRIEKEEVI